jgi:flagellar M-ring protein FliF
VSVRQGGALGALQVLADMPVLRQVGVMAGLAASVALGVWVVRWAWLPGYAVLYGHLPPKEATEVVAGLERAGFRHRLDAQSGAVLVPAEDLHRARLSLAAEGLPHSAELGFEILNKQPELGTSQFLEQARYQRALEVELARSIATLTSVEKARVHLAQPRQSAFVRERRPPTASVLVHLYPGRSLEEAQVGAIAHLVAASVPGMQVGDVRVVDQRGRLLTVPEQGRDALMSQQELDYTRRLEAEHVRRIEGLLAPILGTDGMRAQVVAEVDFTRTEQTRESFHPELSALRSQQVSQETRSGGPPAVGVPGALSNTPPGAGVAPEQTGPRAEGNAPPGATPGQPGLPGAAPGAAGTPGLAAGATPAAPLSSLKYTQNFEVDRVVSHTTLPSATLRRLAVAVVLDDHRLVGEDGQTTRRPLTAEETERFTGLVKEAVGFNPERGDTVNVVNVSFAGGALEEPVADSAPWDTSWAWNLGRQALGVLFVLVLALGVLRPAMRRLTSQTPALAAPAVLGEPRGADAGEPAADRLSLSGGAAVARLSAREQQQQQTEALRALVDQDPRRVAQVVRSWIAQDERGG